MADLTGFSVPSLSEFHWHLPTPPPMVRVGRALALVSAGLVMVSAALLGHIMDIDPNFVEGRDRPSPTGMASVGLLIVSAPVAAALAAPAVIAATGRAWAKVCAVVGLFAVGFTCMLSGFNSVATAIRRPNADVQLWYLALSVLGIVAAAASVTAAYLLMSTQANAHYRAMRDWRLATDPRRQDARR